jgi:hypothetical protein
MTEEFALKGGYPPAESLDGLYEELYYQRACQLYVWATPAVGMEAISEGLTAAGLPPSQLHTVGIFEHFLDARTVVATGNGQSIYALGNIDLTGIGPVVIESPAGVQGFIMSGWQQPLEDVGFIGPDKGAGGAFLVVPPGWDHPIPDGYFVVRSDTLLVNWCYRGFLQDGKPDAAIAALQGMRVYRLAEREDPPPMSFIDMSGAQVEMVPLGDTANGLGFFRLLARFIAREPVREQDKQFLGLARSLGITPDAPFAPNERMQVILQRAARTGQAMTAAIAYDDRQGTRLRWPDHSRWEEVVPQSGTMDFVEADHVDIDGRAALYYQAAGASKAINLTTIGVGSKYAAVYKDHDGAPLDGAQRYRLRIPADVPAKQFWSVVAYDAESRSMLQVEPPITGRDSYQQTLERNDDGSVDLYFGPTTPDEHADNWIPTRPDVGFFLYFRWYGPTEHYYDESWALPDLERL